MLFCSTFEGKINSELSECRHFVMTSVPVTQFNAIDFALLLPSVNFLCRFMNMERLYFFKLPLSCQDNYNYL